MATVKQSRWRGVLYTVETVLALAAFFFIIAVLFGGGCTHVRETLGRALTWLFQ